MNPQLETETETEMQPFTISNPTCNKLQNFLPHFHHILTLFMHSYRFIPRHVQPQKLPETKPLLFHRLCFVKL